MPQFARPEFSVFQSGVSSSIAVTTYLIRLPLRGGGVFRWGKVGKSRDASPRQCYSKRLTERLKTPDAKTEQAITISGRPIPDISRRTNFHLNYTASLHKPLSSE